MTDSGRNTQERVLESACEIFARKGYRETTVAEICEAAGANVAAVNYYFRSKVKLYKEVWRRAVEVNDERYASGFAEGRDAEGILREHIRCRILSIFDTGPGGWLPSILKREIADPTDMFDELREGFLAPRMERVEAAVKELLGEESTDMQARFATVNILSLYAFINMGTPIRRRLFGGEYPSSDQLNAIITQMQEFAVAGLRGVRESIEKGVLS